MSGFGVRPDVVAGHGREVAELANRVQGAADVGAATQAMNGEAYGLIGQVFAQQATAAVEGAVRTMGQTADTAHAMADGVAATAESYRQVERANTGILGGGR